MARQSLAITDIRSTYTEEKSTSASEKDNLWGRFVLRPISYYPTWLFLRLGVSANQVTFSGMVIGFTACLLLAFSNYTGMIVGALLINIWALLDFVDGNIARGSKSSSPYGEFIDSLNTTLVGALLFVSVGAGAFLHPDIMLNYRLQPIFGSGMERGILLFLGSWTALFYFLPRILIDRFKEVFPSPRQVNLIAAQNFIRPLRMVWLSLNNTVGLVPPILLLAVIFRFVGIFLFLWALITTAAFIIIVPWIAIRARRER